MIQYHTTKELHSEIYHRPTAFRLLLEPVREVWIPLPLGTKIVTRCTTRTTPATSLLLNPRQHLQDAVSPVV